MKQVDLSEYRGAGIGLLSGNARGTAVRQAVGLDEADENGEEVTIRVPEDVFAVTASFLSGLVGKSIRDLGEEEFRARFRFVGKRVDETLDAVFRYASKEHGAI